jgi:hypothetical protein
MSLGSKSVSPSCSTSDTWKAVRRMLANNHTAFLEKTEAAVASARNQEWNRALTSLSSWAIWPWALSWKEDMAKSRCETVKLVEEVESGESDGF